MKKLSVFWWTGLLASSVVWAFPVPEESADGVVLAIENFDPPPPKTGDRNNSDNVGAREIDADRPLKAVFSLENRSDRPVTGVFKAWMNDDWTLSGVESGKISLAAGEKKTLTGTALAGERVLPGLYPLHARFVFGKTNAVLHPVAVFKAKTDNRAFRPRKRWISGPGAYRLDESRRRFVYVKIGSEERRLDDPDKPDARSDGSMTRSAVCRCGQERRRGFSGHPPYNGGVGEVTSAWGLELPAIKPVKLRFSAGVPSVKSDGVGVRVLAGEVKDEPETVFSRHISEQARWIDCEADLSRFAGKRIVLRLTVDAGPSGVPHHDGFVISEPVLTVGPPPPPPADAAEVAAKALANARRGEYRLSWRGEECLAGVAQGNRGLVDGALAFVAGGRELVVNGFDCMVDDFPVAESGCLGLVKNRIWVEKGTLRISWEMPGAKRSTDGSPRFTRIAPGPADRDFTRVYFGAGNVVEKPEKFTVSAGGFSCSTRHVGADYDNGVSLVQATDVFPDELVCDAQRKIFSLVTHNDAVTSFTPSDKGAFAAAIRFAAASGYRRSPGYDKLAGRMVLDDWRGDYRRAAEEIALSCRYGIEAVYIQHRWQRWGYDVRLPDIWPPRGDRGAFDAMAAAAEKAGFPLGLHDNYIDLYPDTPGFTYDDVYFHSDGTPHKAWYNPGRRTLSYKWHPGAIWKWHEANMKAMAENARAGALFIDVFTASAPRDFYDRDGRFHAKNVQAEGWAAAFDRARTIFGKSDAVMISEAGHDALIGHVDAGEADHFPATRVLARTVFADGERVPWHDAVSHGKMVLLGGGLGFRYSGFDVKIPGADDELHGYASHDYLCTTAIGGRGTMAEWAFSRKAVFTWWLLGDIQKRLARGSFDSFSFGRDIHEQHSVFSTGEVWVNRSTNRCMNVCGHELPPYGLYARAGDAEAGIVRKNGIDVRFSRSPGKWFVDARPPSSSGEMAYAAVKTAGFTAKGPREGELTVDWDVFDARCGDYDVFVHAVRHASKDRAIVFHAKCVFEDGKDALSRPGARRSKVLVRPWDSAGPGEYDLRLGLCHKKSGVRTPLLGWDDGTLRIFTGIVTLAPDGKLSWRPDEGTERTRELGVNSGRTRVDFGGIVTDGAFRIEAKAGSLVITPLPGSLAFSARIDPRALGLEGKSVDFECDGRAFEYTVRPE